MKRATDAIVRTEQAEYLDAVHANSVRALAAMARYLERARPALRAWPIAPTRRSPPGPGLQPGPERRGARTGRS